LIGPDGLGSTFRSRKDQGGAQRLDNCLWIEHHQEERKGMYIYRSGDDGHRYRNMQNSKRHRS
jgi:hypothetical protein